jgi:hypothetical protein
MSQAGDPDLLIAARSALLDALDALTAHREALVLIGAQAIYLHTGAASVALAETTKDSDLALDTRTLADAPLVEQAMEQAGFHRDSANPQPGGWLSEDEIPVDLMVAEALAGARGRRGVEMAPHSRLAARRTAGLEAAMVDHTTMIVTALAPGDERSFEIKVAGPAALLVAKLHKLGERQSQPHRLLDKDAYDIYRLLVATDTATIALRLDQLRDDPLAGAATKRAIEYLEQLFGGGAEALGPTMAGRAEVLVGDPTVVAAAVSALAEDLLGALRLSANRKLTT